MPCHVPVSLPPTTVHQPDQQRAGCGRDRVAQRVSNAQIYQAVSWAHRYVSSYRFPPKLLDRRSLNTPLSELDLLLPEHQPPKIRGNYFFTKNKYRSYGTYR